MKQQYTRRGALKLLGLGAVVAASFCLAGCGSSGDGIKSASEPVPASQAFSQKSVWMVYDGDDQIGKDEAIKRILAFDGNGNVTVYQCDDATFADLNGLSDEEIIDFAKQQDKAVFDAAKQSAIDSTAEAIEAWQRCYDTMKAEADAGTYDSVNEYGEYGIDAVPEEYRAEVIEQFQTTLENTKNTLDTANEGQAFNKATEYREPQPQPYTLALETDDSGNVAASEEIRFAEPRFSFYEASIDDASDLESPETRFRVLNSGGWQSNVKIPESAFAADEGAVELYSPAYSTTQTVYDTTFGGYSGLATVVNEGHAGFTWDTPDTEGIEVD
ncbi:hypothetical protein B5F40_08750 [Gordonibacter sp. An230]|uniref:hypothetical protein n=1 Tax=Gordonibacter sp. An230 TaxID=1965592 RepID=UPI000B3742DE|nr:hypothetical protein [Gordonibacter sp. An230]OUO89914.1 hypothetical protein B5F40_08750 [Gordonibacter sp. An230]